MIWILGGFEHTLLRSRTESRIVVSRILGAFLLVSMFIGCGSRAAFVPPPIILSVSLSNSRVIVPTNGTPVPVPIVVVAPTETVTFQIIGLPGGISANYKESESNPSGLLTLVASSATQAGTYMPQITVGSSGQTASTVFSLVVQATNP